MSWHRGTSCHPSASWPAASAPPANTAREAIRLLTEEALVTPQHGKGVFVREKQRLFRWGSDRYSRKAYRETGLTPFRIEMQRQGKKPTSRPSRSTASDPRSMWPNASASHPTRNPPCAA